MYSRYLVALLIGLATSAVHANGQLLATGGISTIEGGAGGGIVPWAVLAGYGTDDEWGGTVFVSNVDTGDYRLQITGAAVSWNNRIEVSAARQRFELPTLAANLGLPGGSELSQTIYGLKMRVAGELVYGALPQFSVGLQHKQNTQFGIPAAVGATRDSDTEFYAAASKLWLAGFAGRNLFANFTMRRTRANQTGLLGFGGDISDSQEFVAELSAAVFLNRHTAVGFEYRQKPDNLSFASEDDWRDIFIAWFPDKSIGFAAAWADLGGIASLPRQNGFVISVQGSF